MDRYFYTGTITAPTGDKVITTPALTVGASSTAAVKNSTFSYMIAGTVYSKASAETNPTATVVPANNKFAAFGFEIGVDGTIHNLDAPLNSTGYATASAARTAFEALTATANHVIVGYFIVESDSGTWTGATDDLVAASDCTSVAFHSTTVDYGEEVNLGFIPDKVIVKNRTRNFDMMWDSNMSDDEYYA